MNTSFDIKNLERLLRDFHTAVGIKLSVFDEDFSLVSEYPTTPPSYCSYIRSTQAGAKGCKKCDLEACMRARNMQNAHVYVCHAGLTEAITPIRFENRILGYVILAHMIPSENHDAALDEAVKHCVSYGLEKEKGLSYLLEIQPRSYEQIIACTHLLDAIASYLHIAQLVKRKNEDLYKKLEDFVNNNLQSPPSTEILSRHFLLSRTKLYQIFNEAFGMSISRYIMLKRIEKAKSLLENEDLPIEEIAEITGFSSGNYFSKVFKKETGLSPSVYKKRG